MPVNHDEKVKPKIMKAEVMMKVRNRGAQFSALFFGTLMVSLRLVPSYGFSQAAFFQGKTITVIQGRDPGGTGDLRVKALFPFLQKYIPGNPTIVSEYMPGGGPGREPHSEQHALTG